MSIAHRELHTCNDNHKFEHVDGIITMMSPGSPSHTHTNINIFRILDSHPKKGKCRVYMENMKIHFSKDDIFIPDIAAFCKKMTFTKDGTLTSPDLVVEVLSPSTAKNDRTRKMQVYGKSGVCEYWIIEPSTRCIEVYHNQDGTMVMSDLCAALSQGDIESLQQDGKHVPASSFETSLFGGITIDLYKVFEDILPEEGY